MNTLYIKVPEYMLVLLKCRFGCSNTVSNFFLPHSCIIVLNGGLMAPKNKKVFTLSILTPDSLHIVLGYGMFSEKLNIIVFVLVALIVSPNSEKV